MFEKKNPKVSIVIPSWFKEGQDGKYGKNETFWFAKECLKKLIDRTSREMYELIIIDNGSTLSSEHFEQDYEDGGDPLACYWEKADILIRNKENLGFGPACNQGFNVARGEYIICLNNDILVWEGWLDAMLEPFTRIDLIPKPAIIMPALMRETNDAREALKLERIDLKKNFDSYGAGAEFGSLWCAPRALLRDIANKRDGYQVFDEKYKCGMGEDRQLWCEVRQLGYETYRTHKTRVFHQGNLTIGKVKDRKQYTEKNREMLAEWKKENGVENKGIKQIT